MLYVTVQSGVISWVSNSHVKCPGVGRLLLGVRSRSASRSWKMATTWAWVNRAFRRMPQRAPASPNMICVPDGG